MITRLHSGPRLSEIVIARGFVFLAGVVAEDSVAASGDCAAQTRDCLQQIDRLLAEAGSSKAHLVSAQIFLRDIDRDFAAMNQAWEGWVDPANTPARATVEARMAGPEYLVEIKAIAVTAD